MLNLFATRELLIMYSFLHGWPAIARSRLSDPVGCRTPLAVGPRYARVPGLERLALTGRGRTTGVTSARCHTRVRVGRTAVEARWGGRGASFDRRALGSHLSADVTGRTVTCRLTPLVVCQLG